MREVDHEQVKKLWRSLARTSKAFLAPRNLLVRRDDHWLAPAGWVGIVSLGQSGVVVVPTTHDAPVNTLALARQTGPEVASAQGAGAVFGEIAETLGPSILAYGRGPLTGPASGKASSVKVRGPVRLKRPLVQELFTRIRRDELARSGLTDTDSGLFVTIDAAGTPVSASGYKRVPFGIAHMSVVTATGARGCGYGYSSAAAALRYAASNGLLAQWRAREGDEAALALGRSLGLAPIGRQFGCRLVQTPDVVIDCREPSAPGGQEQPGMLTANDA